MQYNARPATATAPAQALREHLRNVAEKAGAFAEAIGLDTRQAEWAGLLHDLGKYSDEFQRHRIGDEERWRVEHACHGAYIALEAGAAQVAWAIAGHHGGLGDRKSVTELTDRPEKGTVTAYGGGLVRERAAIFRGRAEADGAFAGLPDREALDPDRKATDLRIRMIFSCLVDADRLDAERHCDAFKAGLRERVPELLPSEHLAAVRRFIDETAAASRGARPVREARRRVLEHSLERAAGAPGFFSMTVPTGGGKTLASLAFALAHAAAHGHRRIIYVIPYLSIIEQNVEVIRDALGDTNLVIEHHSNVTGEEECDEAAGCDGQDAPALRRRLLAENWDAPVIVTTTVQFFESLFSNRPRSLRKVHNVARSVVIFDEAQTFPPGMMRPLMAMLKQLADAPYGCTFLFCTATQPALSVEVGGNDGPPAPLLDAEIREVAPDPPQLFAELKRVEVSWPADETPSNPDEIAAGMAEAGRALAVVNTKEQARVLFRALREHDPAAIHLSTRMCPAHRLAKLAEIRDRLRRGEPCLVAATQLVEAGVDLDFPAVWRAMGPLDSIAQAAGRCNREGRGPAPGRVTVFNTWDDKLPPGGYTHATTTTKGMLQRQRQRRAGGPDIHVPQTFTEYFQRNYNDADLDKGKIEPKAKPRRDGTRRALDFPATALAFKIVKEDTTAVLVPYGGRGASYVQLLAEDDTGERVGPRELRAMQRYMVGLYPNELRSAEALIDDTHPSGVRVFRGEYDDALGLVLPGGELEG